MNTPAFTNLLGVRIRASKANTYPRGYQTVEGVVMAISFAEYRVDVAFGVQMHENRAHEYAARGFVALILTDDQELMTVQLDSVDPPTKVI